jgi:hypothetical protein
MSMLKFNDGETFDLSGPLRLERRKDGLYVVGENRMMAVNDALEGKKYIEFTNYQLAQMKDESETTMTITWIRADVYFSNKN